MRSLHGMSRLGVGEGVSDAVGAAEGVSVGRGAAVSVGGGVPVGGRPVLTTGGLEAAGTVAVVSPAMAGGAGATAGAQAARSNAPVSKVMGQKRRPGR